VNYLLEMISHSDLLEMRELFLFLSLNERRKRRAKRQRWKGNGGGEDMQTKGDSEQDGESAL